MPRRHVLTDRQRSTFFDLPTDEVALLRHYTLDDDDIEHVRARRRPQNRLGFASSSVRSGIRVVCCTPES